MAPRSILLINASATAGTAVVMLATRSLLAPLFGLATPLLLDLTAVAFLLYAGVIALFAMKKPVPREALLTFAGVDAAWVLYSAAILILFWTMLTPVARVLVIGVALIVEVFATLQYRAAGGLRRPVLRSQA